MVTKTRPFEGIDNGQFPPIFYLKGIKSAPYLGNRRSVTMFRQKMRPE